MKKKNKGFTLIELIVTVAIIAIFFGVVLSVIGTGANSYIKTSNTAKSQMEAQDIMDQMENMIIDVNRSVYYAYGKGINDGYGNEIRNDIDSSDSSQSKTFFACSAEEKDAVQKKYAYSCDIIEWDSDEQKLYYGCRVWEGVETETTDNSAADGTENGNTGTDTQSITDNNAMVAGISDDSADNTNEKTEDNIIVKSKRTTEVTTKVEKTLIAEDITSFCVDVSKAQTDRIVRFQFTTNKKGKEITTIHTVNLRNQVQIGKPGDGYGTAENGNAWINIVDYPKEINPGEKLSGFSKRMNGNIDPSTVEWIVETANGSFSGTDNIDLALTAADSATGEIRIYVQASTTDGRQIKSQTVGIKVNSKIPAGLEPVAGTNELLLAVGQNYSLANIIQWRIKYSDGTTGESLDAVEWTTTSNIGVSLGNDGELIIPESLGNTSSDSFFKISVSYTDSTTAKTLSGEISIKLARLDLSQPETLYVGDTMPFAYEYKEGGNVITNLSDEQITKSVIPQTNKAAPGKIGEVLTDQDVGKWTAKAEMELDNRGGYGKLKAESSFNVKQKVENGTIEIGSTEANNDTVVAGATYYCSYYNSQGFHVKEVSDFSWNYKIEWSIKGATDSYFMNANNISSGNNDAQLYIGENEHGFTLLATMTIYSGNNQNENEIKHRYEAKRNVKVITDIEIVEPPTPMLIGKTYALRADATVWSINDSGQDVSEKKKVPRKETDWKTNTGHTIKDESWKIEKGQQSGELIADCWGMPNVFFGNEINDPKKKVHLIDSRWTDVRKSAEIIIKDNKTSIFPGDTTQLWLKLQNEHGQITGNVSWESNDDSVKISPDTQNSVYENGAAIPVTVTADSDITQTVTCKITANYTNADGETGTESVDIYVTPLMMSLTHSNDQLFFEDRQVTEQITAYIQDASNDTDVTKDYDITWTVSPEDGNVYTYSPDNNKLNFVVIAKPSSERIVMIKAIARKKNSDNIACTASTQITVNSKITKTRIYNCTQGQSQSLEFDEDDMNLITKSIKTRYVLNAENSQIECNRNNIPTLKLEGDRPENLVIKMNASTTDFTQYRYILISVDLRSVLYNFYIYPIENNVYDTEYSENAGKPYTYVPGDLESIKKMATLESDGYTYKFKDSKGEICELRLSIHRKTGIGSFSGSIAGSSAGKWFMQRGNVYYKYINNGWYIFNNGTAYSWDWYNRAQCTRYYWNLNDKIRLLDDLSGISNKTFWQRWN